MITITGFGDHNQPEWLIIFTGIRRREGLRAGTNALNNDFPHPLLVAREAATVDLLTEGRLQLGAGAVHMQSEYEQAGLDFDAGGTRVERLAEACNGPGCLDSFRGGIS